MWNLKDDANELIYKMESLSFKLKIDNQRSKKTYVQANSHQGNFLKPVQDQFKTISQLEPETGTGGHQAGAVGTEAWRKQGDPRKRPPFTALQQTRDS